MINNNQDENLEQRLRELAEQVKQVSGNSLDAPEKSGSLEQIGQLQQEIASNNKQKKEREPCYSSEEQNLPRDLYKLISCAVIHFEKTYSKEQLEKAYYNDKMACMWKGKYYRAKALKSHLKSIKKKIMSSATKSAVDNGADVVLLDEKKINILFSLSSKHGDIHAYGDVKYSILAIAELYQLKN